MMRYEEDDVLVDMGPHARVRPPPHHAHAAAHVVEPDEKTLMASSPFGAPAFDPLSSPPTPPGLFLSDLASASSSLASPTSAEARDGAWEGCGVVSGMLTAAADRRAGDKGAEEDGAGGVADLEASEAPGREEGRTAVCPCCSCAVDLERGTLAAHVTSCFGRRKAAAGPPAPAAAAAAGAMPPLGQQVRALSGVVGAMDLRVRLGFAESFARLAQKVGVRHERASRAAWSSKTQADLADHRLLRLLHRADAPPVDLDAVAAAAPPPPLPPVHRQFKPLQQCPASPPASATVKVLPGMSTPVHAPAASSAPCLPSPHASAGRTKSQRKLFDVTSLLCDTLPSPTRAAPRALRRPVTPPPPTPAQAALGLKRNIHSGAASPSRRALMSIPNRRRAGAAPNAAAA